MLLTRLLSTASCAALTSSAATVVETVTVANPGNAADTTGFGSIGEVFRIGTYEVTNAQYAEFLNAVDPSATNSLNLYNSSMGSDTGGRHHPESRRAFRDTLPSET